METLKTFSNSGKLLAFAGSEPSTHQSGNYTATMSRMVKRGSKYLRWALLQADRTVSIRVPVFKKYLSLKKSQGKYDLVATSHTAKNCREFSFAKAIFSCSNCSHFTYRPVTCKSKFCSSCGKIYAEKWALKLSFQLIDKKYKHLIFTLPKEIWRFVLPLKI